MNTPTPPQPALYQRASDEELREAGWDPQWIEEPDEDCAGPYAVSRVVDATCPCCGGAALGWTVVNLATATGIGTEWNHDEGGIEAQEHARDLNAAWLAGHEANAATIRVLQAERDRLRKQNRRLREEVNMLVSYGCPVCGGDCASANPPVSGCPMHEARAALAASGEK